MSIYNGASLVLWMLLSSYVIFPMMTKPGEKVPWGTSLLYEVSENEVNENISVIRVFFFYVIILLSTFLLFNSLSFAFFFSRNANYLFTIEDSFPGQP